MLAGPVWQGDSFIHLLIAWRFKTVHAISKDSDQTAQMRWLIWVFADRTGLFVDLACAGLNFVRLSCIRIKSDVAIASTLVGRCINMCPLDSGLFIRDFIALVKYSSLYQDPRQVFIQTVKFCPKPSFFPKPSCFFPNAQNLCIVQSVMKYTLKITTTQKFHNKSLENHVIQKNPYFNPFMPSGLFYICTPTFWTGPFPNEWTFCKLLL